MIEDMIYAVAFHTAFERELKRLADLPLPPGPDPFTDMAKKAAKIALAHARYMVRVHKMAIEEDE